MADHIEESVFDAESFQNEAMRMVAVGELPPWLTIRLWRPFPNPGNHWLLRSLVLMRILN